MDTAAARANYIRLSNRVRGDLLQVRDYLNKTKNPFEPMVKAFYDYYLKANQQEEGIKSYDQVVGWIIAYEKKTGHI